MTVATITPGQKRSSKSTINHRRQAEKVSTSRSFVTLYTDSPFFQKDDTVSGPGIIYFLLPFQLPVSACHLGSALCEIDVHKDLARHWRSLAYGRVALI